MSKQAIYLMPGLAANPKIFEYLSFPDEYQVYPMHFIIPEKEESLSHYTQRLIHEQIKHENPILLGVSFGGMIVQEMSRQIPVKKLILISTVKSNKEFSPFFNKAFEYKLYNFFPSRALAYVELLEKISFPSRFKQKMKLYKKYMDKLPKEYFDWAIKRVLFWNQEEFPTTPFIHIHGENDKVFPVKYINQPVTIIKNARHDMIIFRAKWFNENWNEILNIPTNE